jgi:magnesium chelatase family protein
VLAVARTFTLLGIGAREVLVEVDVHRGLPTFSLVGLPDAAIRESRERVRSALVNSGFEFPLRRITANLAPADLRKAGPGLDLAIAAALLCASGQLADSVVARFRLAGELALDGSIRPVHGVLAMAEEAARRGAQGIAVPAANAPEASLIEGLGVAPLARLEELATLDEIAPSELAGAGAHRSKRQLRPATLGARAPDAGSDPGVEGPLDEGDRLLPGRSRSQDGPDLSELRGQPFLRRALEVAAAGGHNLLIVGPPGAGKSLAARRLPSILPPLDPREAIEVTRIASVSGRPPPPGRLAGRPFRAPHHTISAVGLVGGGVPPRPGEVTHAHRGVLFLDELGEFSRVALEALRQPLEDGQLLLNRGAHSVELPCRFMLVAAANPCPCGHGEGSERCRCSPAELRRYEVRLSGALADRIDVSVSIEQPSAEALGADPGEPSRAVRERVVAARGRQTERLGSGRCNAEVTPREARRHARLRGDAQAALTAGHERLGLSGRGYERVLRVARTIADLGACEWVGAEHVGEAVTLRHRGGSR